MSQPDFQPIAHRGAWRGGEMSKSDFTMTVAPAHLDGFDALLESIRDTPVESITPDMIDLGAVKPLLDAAHAEVKDGHGFVILQAFPADRYSREDLAKIHWVIGLAMGTPMSQSVMGDLLGHVVGVGGKDPKERAYRNSTELAMHTDACDIVGMMCLQTAMSGGISGYVSALSIYNEVVRRRPDLLPILFRGFHYHRFGEEAPGESPVTEQRVPIFSLHEGYLSINYLRAYIDLAIQEMDAPLTDAENEALDLMDEIAHSDDMVIQFKTEPGEAVFFNNLTTLHNRTAFEDAEEESLKRHLLRLWLVAHQPRPKGEVIDMYEGRGIKKQEGRDTYLKRDLDYKEYSAVDVKK